MNEGTSSKKTWTENLIGMKRRNAVLLGGGILIGILFLGGKLFVDENDDARIPTVRAKKGKVSIKITEIGELRAQDQVTISAINDKQIIWLAPEGKWVEKGDTLVILESEKYVLSRGEAQSSVLVARADLRKAESDLEAQQAKEEAARKKYESLPELAKKGFVTGGEVEQARLAYIELKSKTKSFQAGVDAARANVQRARRGLAQQERKLREGVQLAPKAGLVVYANIGEGVAAKKIEVGMVPFEGMDLMYLPDVSNMLVDGEISEVDLSRVSVGLPVEIELDAYPDMPFHGEVATIGDLAKRKISKITGHATGAKVFDVVVRVVGRDERLKPGLTATIDIIVNEYENSVYVPLETIFLNELEETVVYVRKRHAIEMKPVVVADSNDRVAVIRDGLEEGEELLLARPKHT